MQARFRPADDVVFRTIDGEAVILSIGSGLYFGLTPVGTRIWELIDEGRAVGEILATLRLEYDVAEDEMRRDIEALVSELAARRLVGPAPDAAR